MSRGILSREILSLVNFSLGDIVAGVICHGGFCQGDFVTGDFVTWDFVVDSMCWYNETAFTDWVRRLGLGTLDKYIGVCVPPFHWEMEVKNKVLN